MKDTTRHHDGTVTYWSVYEQSWQRRQAHVPDRELAAMSEKERKRVLHHLENHPRLVGDAHGPWAV